MKKTAFVAHSFLEADKVVVQPLLAFLQTYRRLGLEWETAEEAESSSVASKVKSRIDGRDIFIGIFTRRHLVATEGTRTPGWREALGAIRTSAHDRKWLSSTWTIQESGYAIARNQKLIFLVENGAADIGGLQSDCEYIPFARGHLEPAIQKLSEVLSKLLGESAHDLSAGPSAPPKDASDKPEKANADAEGKGQETPFIFRLFEAMVRRKDVAEGKRLLDEELARNIAPEEKVSSQCWFFHFKYGAGQPEAFGELETLASMNPQNYEPLWNLGLISERLKEHKRAAEYMGAAARLCTDISRRAGITANAAGYLAAAGEFDAAYTLLESEKTGPHDNKTLATIYNKAAEIAQLQKDAGLRAHYLELALAHAPADPDSRFSLAYNYSESGAHRVALYHYKILVAQTPPEHALNNLGVEYSELGLEGKAIETYENAVAKGSTLAAANLAGKLTSAGFYVNARTILEKSSQVVDHHSNVERAISALDSASRDQDEREKAVLAEAELEARYRADFADAFAQGSDGVTSTLEGTWATVKGRVLFKVVQPKVEGTGEELRKEPSLISRLAGKESESVFKRKLSFHGSTKGRTVSGRLNVEDESSDGWMPDGGKKAYDFFAIINLPSSMSVMLVDEKGAATFHRSDKLL